FRRACLNPRSYQVKQHLAYRLPVEQAVVPLVRVGHEAIVAGRFTVLLRPGGTAYVGPSLWIKVAEAQGLPCDLRERLRFLEQSLQHACPSLSRFIQEDAVPLALVGQRFSGKLIILELVLHLDRAF